MMITIPSTLRLVDLAERDTTTVKLVNVHIPESVMAAIDTLAAELHCTKASAVIALLNEGLDAFDERRGEFPRVALKRRKRRGRPQGGGNADGK